MNRAALLLLPVIACIATPLAAQSFSDSFSFLKAVRNRDAATVQRIVSDPSSTAVNTRDPGSGEGALHILVEQRNLEWLAYLLSRGARPDIQSNDGNTPLALAARLGWTDGAAQLVARGARVDLANNRGETPLILVVQARQISAQERLGMVRLLLSRGADPAKADSFAGYSALDYARQDGQRAPEIVRALEARPAAPTGEVYGPN